MQIQAAQAEMRSVFSGGSIGQAVSGLLWLISAALGTLVSARFGVIALVIGGMFIYPLTQLALRLLGRPSSAGKENALNQLAMQVAFTIPLTIPVIAGATYRNINWFYPAFLIVVGAHYLPFVTLYGMWQYYVLAAVLIGGGVLIAMILPATFSAGGWFGAIVLLLFALLIGRGSLRQGKRKIG